jgi:crotonobetainyl-CoA:carnitine CoA-transferase CaiB-like acyl-CoA transferase
MENLYALNTKFFSHRRIKLGDVQRAPTEGYPMSRLLEGLKVVDFTHVLAGPYCTYQLSLLGADVTRIEHPDSVDLARTVDFHAGRRAARMAAGYLATNANKRSLALDLSCEEGQRLARRLIADADVVVENFRPGVLDKLGLGAKAMTEMNNRLVYCSISGFGQHTSWSRRMAYDDVVQAMSGLISITGTEESGPVMTGSPIIDYVTGLMAAFAVTAAVTRQVRTGQGEIIDVAMLDSAMSLLGPVFALQYISDMPIALRGNRSFSGSPFSGLYEASEGSLVVVANTPRQAEALLHALELDFLWENDSVRDWRNHPDVAEILGDHLRQAFLKKSADSWEVLLTEAHVPAGKVRSLPEMMNHPYTAERGFRHEIFIPALGETLPVPGVGFLAEGENGHVDLPPPVLGQHSIEVLRGVGVDDAELDRLLETGVIMTPDGQAQSESAAKGRG